MSQLSRRHVLTGTVAASAATALPTFMPQRAIAAAPLAGKQTAGWYRYKVGSFEVTVATDGARTFPLPDTFVKNASKDAVNAALTAGYMERDKITAPYTPVVVNTGSKLVVFDTGLGPQQYEQSKGALGQFHSNIAAAGIDRNQVDTVIISHFHADHINGLLTGDNKAAFPKAEVLVPSTEWAYWMDDGNMSRASEGLKPNFTNARRVFDALGRKVTQYDAGKEVVPGVTSMATPGHTPGHASYVVASGGSQVIVQADVTAALAVLFVRNPGWQGAFDMDGAVAEQSRRKLYEMAAADKVRIQGFHFPFPSLGNIEKDGTGYRLVPVAWNATL